MSRDHGDRPHPDARGRRDLGALLDDPNRNLAFKAAAALNDRLPEPLAGHPHEWKNPVQLEDANVKLVQGTWRGEFDGPVRRYACELLAESDPRAAPVRGFMLEAVGAADDVAGPR